MLTLYKIQVVFDEGGLTTSSSKQNWHFQHSHHPYFCQCSYVTEEAWLIQTTILCFFKACYTHVTPMPRQTTYVTLTHVKQNLKKCLRASTPAVRQSVACNWRAASP